MNNTLLTAPSAKPKEMKKENNKKKYLVKDFDGESTIVVADKWECGGNGLKFYLKGDKVAHFLNWSSYITISA